VTAPLLDVRNLRVHFAIKAGPRRSRQVVRAVEDLSFQVHRGETLGLVGESGCGKSTTGMAVQGLVPATSGDILLGDVNMAKLRPSQARAARRRTQMVFQDPTSSLNARMTVGQVLEEPLVVHHLVPPRERQARVRQLLDAVGMPATSVHRYPHEFSGGQRQRIAIARAIIGNPEFVVCDEPVSALDLSVQAQVLNLLVRLRAERGLSYLFVSHDLGVVRYLSDDIVVMHAGRIVERGPAAVVGTAPTHPYTRALIAAAPVPDPEQQRLNRDARRAGQHSIAGATALAGCSFAARCAFATDVCRTITPPLTPHAAGHLVACHYAESLPEPVTAGSTALPTLKDV
jgi:oligopeptide/dipeptide ABC transporter ATP-binding protein